MNTNSAPGAAANPQTLKPTYLVLPTWLRVRMSADVIHTIIIIITELESISFYRPNGGARYTIGKIIDFRPISRYIPETVGLQDRYIDAACAAVLTKENLR